MIDNAAVCLGGLPVDLLDRADADRRVIDALAGHADSVWVASANLDKITHFGSGSGNVGQFDDDRWLLLLDGSPLVRAAARLTGRSWPQLAGSDLLPSWMELANDQHATLGIVGGTTDTHERFGDECAQRWPNVRIVAMLDPTREETLDPVWNSAAAESLRSNGATLVILALSNGQMERWTAAWGEKTGARVILCFGAAMDFITQDQRRAPAILQRLGLEWLWRLMLSPRRLARRYLIEGPRAWWILRTSSSAPSRDT